MRRAVLGLLVVSACHHAHPAKTVNVTIHAMAFDPRELTVDAGDTLVFENQDLVAHTVTDKGGFDSGPIAPHATWKLTLDRPGTYPYVCTLHVTMSGTITVR